MISLAAHLQTNVDHHVDIEELYHSGIRRIETFLVDPARAHVVHEFREFRAPFLQWLFPLFVDVSDRDLDTYPVSELATNPYDNALRYQRECQDYLGMLGRELFLQPDAGDDGTGTMYEQFSCYHDFGQPSLFMPWSVAFSLLADSTVGDPALRHYLQNGLHGPLGLSDSTIWETGAPAPTGVPARHDFWNLSLSTMALMQYSFEINKLLAGLPEVSEALDKVYVMVVDTDADGIRDTKDNCIEEPNGTLIPDAGGNSQLDTDGDGYGNLCDPDFNGDLTVNAADLAYMKTHFFTTDADADLTGDGIVNAADLAITKIMFFGPPGPSGLAP